MIYINDSKGNLHLCYHLLCYIKAVQSHEMKTNHERDFISARDSCNRKIPGMQIRNGKFYGYFLSEAESGNRSPRS